MIFACEQEDVNVKAKTAERLGPVGRGEGIEAEAVCLITEWTMRTTEENTGSTGRTVRVFFAIWPDNAAQKQLAALAKQLQAESLCGGRKIKPENIHLTLVFVGEVDSRQAGSAIPGSRWD